MRRYEFVLSLALGVLPLVVAACDAPPPDGLLGAYRFPDGRIASVRPSLDGTLRYRMFASGESGRMYPVSDRDYVSGPGFLSREPVVLEVRFDAGGSGVARRMLWTPVGAPPVVATRIGRERSVTFASGDVTLAGRLHVPEGEGPWPAVVLVHGSGDQPGSRWLYNGDFFVAHGIAVLAYDKRGTGRSGGEFTFDFHRLAADVAAGVRFLRTLDAIDGDRIGLAGYSQGGWVAPLAASRTDVAFVLVSYGMIESPAQEARLEMIQRLREDGVHRAALQAADSLVTAAIAVVASGLDDGWGAFETLKRRYRDAPWLPSLDDTPIDQLMTYPRWLVKIVGRRKLPPGLPWQHDSHALLDTLGVPMTWFLAAGDRSAPNEATISELRRLQASGRPYQLEVFPRADHGMLVFREEDGHRVATGYAPGYYRAEVDAAWQWLAEIGRNAGSIERPTAARSMNSDAMTGESVREGSR